MLDASRSKSARSVVVMSEDTKARWFVIAATLIGAAIRLALLDSQSLWADEVTHKTIAKFPFWDVVTNPEGWPPLYILFVKFLFLIGFESDLALRLFSAAAGIVSIPVAYLLFCRLDQKIVALVATFLLALNPMAVWYSMELGVYSLMMLCGLLSTHLMLSMLSKPTMAHRLGYAMLALIGCGVHYLYAFVLLTHGLIALWDIVTRKDRRVAWLWTAASVIGALLVLAPGFYGDFVLHVERGLERPAVESFFYVPGYTALAFAGGNSFGPSVREIQEALDQAVPITNVLFDYRFQLALAALVCFIPTILAFAQKLSFGRVFTLLMFVMPPALGWVSSFVVFAYRPRYAIAALPFFLLWAASSLVGRYRAVALAGIILLFGVQIYALTQINDPRYVREDFRAAADFMQENSSDATILVLGPVALANYLDEDVEVVYFPPHYSIDVERLERNPIFTSEVGGDVWLFVSRPWIFPNYREVLDLVNERFDRGESATYPGVEVIRLIRKDR